jgi:hypothetical protein
MTNVDYSVMRYKAYDAVGLAVEHMATDKVWLGEILEDELAKCDHQQQADEMIDYFAQMIRDIWGDHGLVS